MDFRTTPKGQRVSDKFEFDYGTIVFRENSKSNNPRFTMLFTSENHKGKSMKSVREEEIPRELNMAKAYNNLCTSEVEFISYIMNDYSEGHNWSIEGLTSEDFEKMLEYYNNNLI